MAGPSAIGSVKGMPSSMMSAPPSTSASRIAGVSSTVGSPAVTKVTSAARPAFLQAAKRVARRSVIEKVPVRAELVEDQLFLLREEPPFDRRRANGGEIGRASCRERGGKYGYRR